MNSKESVYPSDWFKIGDREIKRARNLLDLQDIEGACFNLQQAIEKYLKGYLLSQGWQLRRIHDLDTLLNEALTYDNSFEFFRPACQKITQYYVEDRYPFTAASELTGKEAEESFAIAEALIKKIQTLVT